MRLQKTFQKSIAALLMIAMLLSFLPIGVFADGNADTANNVSVQIRIEGSDVTIVPEKTIQVGNFDLSPYHCDESTDSPRAVHAIIAALEEEGLDCTDEDVLNLNGGSYLSNICGLEATTYGAWMYYINDQFVTEPIDGYELKENDSIVVFFCEDWMYDYYSWFDSTQKTVEVGEEVYLTLNGRSILYDMYDMGNISSIAGADITVNESVYGADGKKYTTDADGKVKLKFDAPDTYTICAQRFNDEDISDISRPYCKITVTDKIYGPKPVTELLQEVTEYYKTKKNNLESWWELGALVNAGENPKNTQWSLPQWKTEDLKTTDQATTYAGYILGFLALGEDPKEVWDGRDITAELTAKQSNDGSFGAINSHIWAMIALDAARVQYNAQDGLTWLLTQQKSDGGFSFGGNSGDPDLTGMALIAMSNHQDNAGQAIENAVQFLHNCQSQQSGGFSSWGNENANTIATVISGLVAAGEDVLSDSWKKNGKSMSDALMAYQMEDKSFCYITSAMETNPSATVQAYIALGDICAGDSIWKRLAHWNDTKSIKVNLRVEGIEKTYWIQM